MLPTAEDLARSLEADLRLCEALDPAEWSQPAWDRFGGAARAGWPAAIRRALAAESLLRRVCLAAGPDGYAELTAALDEARALLGLPVRPLAPTGPADAPGRPGECLSDPD